MSDRRCVAIGCNTPVHRKRLMCRRHWSLVPERLRAAVQSAWNPLTLSQSEEYVAAVRAAVAAVALPGTQELPL